jgi:UDP-N-acetylmuramate--alanine ligase
VIDAFRSFIARVPESGTAVLCADDPVLMGLAQACRGRVVTYGRDDSADVRLVSASPDGVATVFGVRTPDGVEVVGRVAVPGGHMALNATAVLAAVWALGLDVEAASEALGAFTGVKRRFERVGEVAGIAVVDDYAHHPTEVAATLKAARESGFSRIWVVFQPHRYTRTAALGSAFGDAFTSADRVVLMDVYSAGETPLPGVSGKTVLDSMLLRHPRTRAAYFPHRGDVPGYLADRARDGDLVMTMGAGDVTTMGPEIVRALEERRPVAGAAGGGTACR